MAEMNTWRSSHELSSQSPLNHISSRPIIAPRQFREEGLIGLVRHGLHDPLRDHILIARDEVVGIRNRDLFPVDCDAHEFRDMWKQGRKGLGARRLGGAGNEGSACKL